MKKIIKVLSPLIWLIRFVIGWSVWIIIAVSSAILSIILLTFNEVGNQQNMEVIINHTCGKSVWKAMMFNNPMESNIE